MSSHLSSRRTHTFSFERGTPVHTVEYNPFINSQLAPRNCGPCVVQIWSRNTPIFGPNDTRVAHREAAVVLFISIIFVY